MAGATFPIGGCLPVRISDQMQLSRLVVLISSMESPVPDPSHQKQAEKRGCVFIVNPNGANGITGNTWKKIFPKFSAQLTDYNVSEKLTTGPNHAVQLTRQAIKDGAAAVVAVGGDGTLNEVVNGFFEDGKLIQQIPDECSDGTPRAALGLIPMGTASDFARVFNWEADSLTAVKRIATGERKKIDVGKVVYGKDLKERFFIGVADLHLSAKAGFFAGMHKRLGNLCYVVGALQGFQGHQNRDMKIRVDGGEWETVSKVTSICIANSKYFGGGMKIAPTADPFSGDLEVVTFKDFKWYDFLLQLRNLYQGTHVDKPNVTSVRARTLDVEEVEIEEGYGGTFVQADGEHLGTLNASFSVLPSAIDFIV